MRFSMGSYRTLPKGDYHEERIARLVELAQHAQDAADAALDPDLREMYLRLASQWGELATKAEQTAQLARGPELRIVPDISLRSGIRS